MQPVNPETFGRSTSNEILLRGEEVSLDIQSLLARFGAIHGWTPVTPSPPPLYSNRNASTFIPRAPSRIVQPAGQPGGGQNPVQQDRRLTRQGETVQIVLNGLLRNGDIIRYGSEDFRLSWLIPQVAGVDAPILTIFYDTTTGFVSYKDENGVIFPFTGGGSGSGSIDGGGP